MQLSNPIFFSSFPHRSFLFSAKSTISSVSVFILFVVALCGCGSDGGGGNLAASTNPSTAYKSATLAPDAQCPAGGVTVASGIDDNGNGILDTQEVDLQQVICNGENGGTGANGLIETTIVSAGAICAAGGLQIDSGMDANSDGQLDSSEIQKTDILCNGVDGTNGTDGINGINGVNGLSSLFTVTPEPAGQNCANAGTRIDVGLDNNQNLQLDAEEILQTDYLCNGANGTNGVDGNNGANGTDGTNGTNGSNGLNSLVTTSPELAGANCADGGIRMDVGLDENLNSQLDTTERLQTNYLCNGANGTDGANGTNGIDGNNGANGTDGTNGSNGLNSLVTINPELAGFNCINGGTRIDVGLDDNRNSILDPAEIDSTQYVCGAAPTLIPDLLYVADPRLAGFYELYAGASDGSGSAMLFAPQTEYGGIGGPQLSPDHQYLCFSSFSALYVANLNSLAPPQQVSLDSEQVRDYVWAPDSSFLVVTAASASSGGFTDTIYRVFPDGSGRIQLNGAIIDIGSGELATYGRPQFSPDGSQFVALLEDAHVTALRAPYVFDSATMMPRNISANEISLTDGDVSDVQWSPDGSQLVFLGQSASYSDWRLYAVSPDGLIHKSISGSNMSGTSGGVQSFKWSSSGNLIAFQADIDTLGVDELFTVTPDGVTRTKVSGTMAANGDVLDYQWSPDGNKLAYLADQAADGVNELYEVSGDGIDLHKVSGTLASGGDVLDYQWSPDSSRLAFRADLDLNLVNELYTVVPNPLTTPAPVKVSGNTGLKSSPLFERGVIDYQWAPDSSALALRGDIDAAWVYELYVGPAAGGTPVNISNSSVSGANVQSFSWTSDSAQLVMLGDLLTDGMNEVFAVNADGAGQMAVSLPLPAGSTVPWFLLR